MIARGPAAVGKSAHCDSARWRTVGAVIACAVLASCAASSDPAVELGLAPASQELSGEDAGGAGLHEVALVGAGEIHPSPRPDETTAEASQAKEAATDTARLSELPSEGEEQEAARPPAPEKAADSPRPPDKRGFLASLFTSASTPSADARPEDADETAATSKVTSPEEETQKADPPAAAEKEDGDGAPKQVAEAAPEDGEQEDRPAKRGFLAAFFSPAEAAPREHDPFDSAVAEAAVAEPQEPDTAEKPKVTLAAGGDARLVRASFSGEALPGVRENEALFDIVRKSEIGDISDLYEQEATYEVASAAGLARLAPHGLLKQRESVDVSCFKPALVRMLKNIERHYGKRVVVTSGYRSPEYNRRVRGARNSMHMYCAAADIQVPGVSKWELARYVRALPGRGGVGTYCHTKSVHVDIGPERDWNWRCRRKR